MNREAKDFASPEELSSYLKNFGVPLENWGRDGTKTVKHLLSEIQNAESILKEVDGKLIRYVTGVGINVYYKDDERTFRLEEYRQVFNTGQQRQRNIPTSLGEKMFPGETPKETASRGLKEELRITGYDFDNPKIEDRVPKPSETYPGLLTKHLIYVFDVTLRNGDYKPEGYREVQPDKTTYFVWHEIK
jgi:hypothetical protein